MAEKPKRAPVYIEVPAGARVQQCRSPRCNKAIYKVSHPKTNNLVPVDCDVEGGFAPTATEPGRGVSHFGTCVDAKDFRRAR